MSAQPLRVRSTDPDLFNPADVDEQLYAFVQSVRHFGLMVARGIRANLGPSDGSS